MRAGETRNSLNACLYSDGHACNGDNILVCMYKLGHKGQLAPRCRALDAMIKKFYHGVQKSIFSKLKVDISKLKVDFSKIKVDKYKINKNMEWHACASVPYYIIEQMQISRSNVVKVNITELLHWFGADIYYSQFNVTLIDK